MCGISCAVTFKGHSRDAGCSREDYYEHEREYLSRALEESLSNISHRGPDAGGQWINDNCHVGKYNLPTSKSSIVITLF